MATIRIDPPSFSYSQGRKTIFTKKILLEANGFYDINSIKSLSETLQNMVIILDTIEKNFESLSDDEKLKYRENHPELFKKIYAL